ncbi:MAG: hypothetical protein ACRCZT_00270 [Plesiomonas sp.]
MKIRSTPFTMAENTTRVSSKQLNQLVKKTERLNSNLKKNLKRLSNATDDNLNIISLGRKKLLLAREVTEKKLKHAMEGITVDQLQNNLNIQQSKKHDEKSKKIDMIKENLSQIENIIKVKDLSEPVNQKNQAKLYAKEVRYRVIKKTGQVDKNKNLMEVHRHNRFSFKMIMNSLR